MPETPTSDEPSTAPRVLVLHDRPEDFRDLLEVRFPDLPIAYACAPDEVQGALESLRATIVFSIKHPGFPGPTHRPIMTFPSVEWVQVGGSGYEHLLPWDGGRLRVTNCAGVLAPYLAETVTGAMILLNGGFIRYLDQQRRALWQPNPFRSLRGQSLLVVGLGRIGGLVAAHARALGMRILAVRRTQAPHPAVDALFAPADLHAALAQADVVTLHLRLTEETRHLIGRRALAAMKPGALLINTARGAVVDEAALVDALESGHLGGAYLDVFEEEPLPPENPLWRLENVFLTPHASDNVENWPRRFAEFFADNLERRLSGAPLLNLVET